MGAPPGRLQGAVSNPQTGPEGAAEGPGVKESPELCAERELKGKADHLSFAAHEVRNPLSTALWSAELLVRMAPVERSGARGEKVTAMCLRALRRLQLLIEDHFLIERLDVHGLPMRLVPRSLVDLVTAAVRRRPPDSGPCTVENLPEVLFDVEEAMFGRALDAILHAAGRDGAPLRISSIREGERVILEVKGAAPGPAALADPERGTESDTQGHSLSLAMAKRVVRALGGELGVFADGYRLALPMGAPVQASQGDGPTRPPQ